MLENLRQVAIIESTESSNRLEGVTLPRTAMEILVRRNAEPKAGNRSQGEIAGYRNVLQLVHERHEHMELTPNLVLQLHRDLFKFSGASAAGRWKVTDNIITERRPDGSTFVRFTPMPARRTQEAMETLHRAFAAAGDSEIDPLILTALYVLDFLCIHPFSDGNGRMARLITVLLLYREDYEVARYISLERLVERTKEGYTDTLYRASQGSHESAHDPMPWVGYFLGVVRAASGEFRARPRRVARRARHENPARSAAIGEMVGGILGLRAASALPQRRRGHAPSRAAERAGRRPSPGHRPGPRRSLAEDRGTRKSGMTGERG